MKLAINSATLRSLHPEQLVHAISNAGFRTLEWAGDAHVPPGDIQTAVTVNKICKAAGVESLSYGSYYQCDCEGPADKGPFAYDLGGEAALLSAQTLGVSNIRVWAGRRASAAASQLYRATVAKQLSEFCQHAQGLGMSVHLEFHRNTLTDSAASTLDLLTAVSKDNLYSYWQPRHGIGVEENVADINALGERLSHVHVFHWLLKEDGFAVDRRPLVEGKPRWQAYFTALEKLPGERYAMMEFVRDDSLNQFHEDAKILQELNSGL